MDTVSVLMGKIDAETKRTWPKYDVSCGIYPALSSNSALQMQPIVSNVSSLHTFAINVTALLNAGCSAIWAQKVEGNRPVSASGIVSLDPPRILFDQIDNTITLGMPLRLKLQHNRAG